MSKIVTFDYNNHRGELTKRTVEPIKIWFGKTKFQDYPQWFLHGFDFKKNIYRDYVLEEISHWKTIDIEGE